MILRKMKEVDQRALDDLVDRYGWDRVIYQIGVIVDVVADDVRGFDPKDASKLNKIAASIYAFAAKIWAK